MERGIVLTAALEEVFGALRSLLTQDLTREAHGQELQSMLTTLQQRSATRDTDRIQQELLPYAQERLERMALERRPRRRPPWSGYTLEVPSLWEVEIEDLGKVSEGGESFAWVMRGDGWARDRARAQLERHPDTRDISSLMVQGVELRTEVLRDVLSRVDPVEIAITGASFEAPEHLGAVEAWTRLRVLDLRSNPLSDGEALARELQHHSIHTLRLSHTRLTRGGWDALSQALPQLRDVMLSHCPLGPHALRAPLPTSVTHVRVAGTECATLEGLLGLKGLEELHAQDNALEDAAIAAWLEVGATDNLRVLDLSRNPWLDEGLAHALERASLPELRRLRLRGADAYPKVMAALARNPTLGMLEELTVRVEAVSRQAAQEIVGSQTLPAALRALWMRRVR